MEAGTELVGEAVPSLEEDRRNGCGRIDNLLSSFCTADLGKEVRPVIKVRIFGITFSLGGSVAATSWGSETFCGCVGLTAS